MVKVGGGRGEGEQPWSREALRLSSLLTKRELARVLSFCNACLTCEREEELHASLLEFARVVGYEFLLYAYMNTRYDSAGQVVMKNLSNPPAWMEEYDRKGYLEHDPVRRELERYLARKQTLGAFCWDAYDRTLSAIEEEIIARRSHYGLRTGFSAFCDSWRHDAVFLVSFATRRELAADERALELGKLVAEHLNRCRKRMDLSSLVKRLTRQERAVAGWLVDGKTNGEIAKILEVSEATAKFHVANILAKLHASSRQGAVSVLIAERCLA